MLAVEGVDGIWTSREVCSIAGITYRQLDYWTRCGYITPSVAPARGSGTWRRWDDSDMEACCALAKLSALGTPQRVFRHVARLMAERGNNDAFLVLTPDGRAELCDDTEVVIAVIEYGVCTVVALTPAPVATLAT